MSMGEKQLNKQTNKRKTNTYTNTQKNIETTYRELVCQHYSHVDSQPDRQTDGVELTDIQAYMYTGNHSDIHT